jgi:hypothetical protein
MAELNITHHAAASRFEAVVDAPTTSWSTA